MQHQHLPNFPTTIILLITYVGRGSLHFQKYLLPGFWSVAYRLFSGSVIKIISHLPEARGFVFNVLGIQNLLQSEVSRV